MEIPDACTLPTAERPLRVAEFDALFATAARAVEWIGPARARVVLDSPDSAVRDLTAREAACCSFFDFTVTGNDHRAVLEIHAPERYADVLASLVGQVR